MKWCLFEVKVKVNLQHFPSNKMSKSVLNFLGQSMMSTSTVTFESLVIKRGRHTVLTQNQVTNKQQCNQMGNYVRGDTP